MGEQTWRTFIKNHAKQVYACDFLTQYTTFFTVVYVFVVMEIASRQIVLINVTTSPSLAWVKQQIRQMTPWGNVPRFLIHENDGIFGQYRDGKQRGEKCLCYGCHLDLWLADVLGIEGIPIPYGALNASPLHQRSLGDASTSDKEQRGRSIPLQTEAPRARWPQDTLNPRPSIWDVEGA